jgi:ribosomal protein S18 acetylase RimI-like enzyme
VPLELNAAAGLGISCRRFTEDDLPFVAELYASTRREEVAVTGWPAEVQEAFLRQQHEAQHSHYSIHYAQADWLILKRGGKAIGRLYLGEEPGQFLVIDISLVPECRGEGIGGAILRDVLDLARSRAKPVAIHVEKNNPARRLYARLGFETVEEGGIYDLMRSASV